MSAHQDTLSIWLGLHAWPGRDLVDHLMLYKIGHDSLSKTCGLREIPIFLEFSITCRVGTKWNDNFYFLSLSALSNLFWIEMKR